MRFHGMHGQSRFHRAPDRKRKLTHNYGDDAGGSEPNLGCNF
jgi:hypothetical protein